MSFIIVITIWLLYYIIIIIFFFVINPQKIYIYVGFLIELSLNPSYIYTYPLYTDIIIIIIIHFIEVCVKIHSLNEF